LVEAVAYVRSQPKMMFVLTLVFFVGTFGMNFQLTSALMATQIYHKGAGEFGLLGSALAVGSLTGALMAARRTRIRLRLLVFGGIGFGVAEIIAATLPTYGLFALCCPLIGFSALTVANTANSTMQLSAEPTYRGRVMALYMTVFQGGTPIGAPIIGWIGQAYGARWTLIVGGAFVLFGAALAIALLLLASRRSSEPVPAF
ncbi:MAG TPA: MFS transporter, partial [Nocardioides sp.]|nr:MFS transporter [Nocardioides sp.]